jgi:alpha-galactosidase
MTAQGVVIVRHELTNIGQDEWSLAALRCLLPLPDEATERLDFSGRWALERVPQRGRFDYGIHARESRRGRTGHDAATLLCVGEPGFGTRQGNVWAVHLGWSGNHEHLAERQPDSVGALGAGELLDPGEISLEPGESYTTPDAYFIWSGSGLDGLRDRCHRLVRARPTHPRSARPVVLNTWEAVYFAHDLDKLRHLADLAAQVGVELFVLDDGWFRRRRDDTAGLGDWFTDDVVWPQGLGPLADHVRARGMRFGLWFEPEMVNPDSDLAAAHPGWLLAAPGRWPGEYRHQHVLDLSLAEVYRYLLERLDSLIGQYRLDFLKWDHNRDLSEAVHRDGVGGVHRQTRAVYRLLDELRARHPRLEIESCSSGGARIDLGMLRRTDRVWTSDSNDPIDRQRIQLWTGLLLPPELMGSHVGAPRAHATGRVTSLALRCATALFAHAGIEWDLTSCSPGELTRLTAWVGHYKRLRPLLHSGRTVVPQPHDASAVVVGVVAADRRQAVFSYAQLASTPANSPTVSSPMRLRLPGLHPRLRYRVSCCLPPDHGKPIEALVIGGAALESVGIPVSRLNPGDATVLELHAVT